MSTDVRGQTKALDGCIQRWVTPIARVKTAGTGPLNVMGKADSMQGTRDKPHTEAGGVVDLLKAHTNMTGRGRKGNYKLGRRNQGLRLLDKNNLRDLELWR